MIQALKIIGTGGAAVYSNPGLQEKQIRKENKGKSGIYRWTNLLHGKSYIGSSVDLSRRLGKYFNFNQLAISNMVINKALLKHDISNFSLEILEYCEPENAVSREQYYIDLLNPEYNILKIAGSSLGFKHSDESRAKMSAPKSEATRTKLSALNKGKNNPMFGKTPSPPPPLTGGHGGGG
jgi:group I intron endonuclease